MLGQRAKVTSVSSPYVEKMEMMEQEKQKKRRGLYRRLTFYMIVALALTFMFFNVYHSQMQVIEAKQQQSADIKQKMERLEAKKETLQQEIEQLQDPHYIGEIARKEYFFSRPNETIFTVPTPSSEN